MAVIRDDRDGGVSSSVKITQVQQKSESEGSEAEAAQEQKSAEEPVSEGESLGFGDADKDDDDDDYDDDDDVYQEFEEYEDISEFPDSRSIASDDSFYPPDNSIGSPRSPSPEPISFFRACCTNNTVIVRIMIRQGLTEEEVRETDRNSRTGLIVACYQGYLDVVIALAQCPYLDVNWQDKEGNTALITAAQAGHTMISHYLLNYFPGLDMERRNCHGFSALMKAAMQGRADCVRALMLAGGDMEATDYGRKLTPREWALFTGRYETARVMARLMARPCAEQFCAAYRPEWPQLAERVSKARANGSCLRRLAETLCCSLRLAFCVRTAPRQDGVLDHMVRVTTALGSPFVATACRTVCPGSPPCVGKRRPAVQEILRRQRQDELRDQGSKHLTQYHRLFQNSRVLLVPRAHERRSSLQPPRQAAATSAGALRRGSLMPLHLLRRSSVRPGQAVPRLFVSKAPSASCEPTKVRTADSHHLQVPRWRYKELKEERRRVEGSNKGGRLEPLAQRLSSRREN
uniref:Ankyrin repeat domain 33B n=1 Tax=Paramormyrops kingsleyae TaxID=1676925 RepID=A0A3B3SFH0_9TELE|nr:ankyrin repeat domain-containing protein 33B-like [Paramormyrops kingsleyae]XP_023651476.1 ankyrin repeat domain-containing protein 33B-like [Paramormyrops kingsleyae]XP_023651477.1 ankyrin repeat domain-containing protein 33B-like [Paramormyrops kingsleyae]XP_023651478.1 ankyrin repeat domain-containing protein 33B-like [Paramormyrops kingsleyae]XP_023651479.1 ankyrin repeat domain-containing protein 33B-like [Paramormyrops kingsleyae]